jgi:hypothetical protein
MTKKLLLISILLLSLGASCPPNPPTPTPTPTPTPNPGPDQFPDLILKKSGFKLTYPDGMPFPFREGIACCAEVEGSGWPLFTKWLVDRYINLGRVTVLHARIGPFATWNEPEYTALGGPYVENRTTFKVDLDQWNPDFWNFVGENFRYANEKGIVIEVVPVDDWVLKTEVYGSSLLWRLPDKKLRGVGRPYPWRADANIQGEDATSQAPGPRQEAWIRKVVHEFGKYGVVWQLGNEENQNQGYNYQAVTVARARIVRDQEKIDNYTPHLLSQNSSVDESFDDPNTDWTILHNYFPSEPFGNPPKITSNNEYNPEPAATCNEVFAKYCKGKKYGSYIAAWRHSQIEPEWQCLLGSISQDQTGDPSLIHCTPELETGCAYDVRTVTSINCKFHSGNLWDCTPKIGSEPVRPEGEIDRGDCEAVACGTVGQSTCAPVFYLTNTTGDIAIEARKGNPIQFTVSGTGSGSLVCKTPATGDANLCNAMVTR